MSVVSPVQAVSNLNFPLQEPVAPISPVQPLPTEEDILTALANEPDNTPLKMFYELHRHTLLNREIPIVDRLKGVVNDLYLLSEQTFGKKIELRGAIGLDMLRQMQQDILEANLYEIARLMTSWSSCCLGLEQAKSDLAVNQEKLRDKLSTAIFSEKLALRCTFLPPEIIRCMDKAQWTALAERSLFPDPLKPEWAPHSFCFLQSAIWGHQFSDEAVESWAKTAMIKYANCSSQPTRLQTIAVLAILGFDSQAIRTVFEKTLLEAAESKPHLIPPFLAFSEYISDEALERALIILSANGSVELHADSFFALGERLFNNPAFEDYFLAVARRAPQQLALFLAAGERISDDALSKALIILVGQSDPGIFNPVTLLALGDRFFKNPAFEGYFLFVVRTAPYLISQFLEYGQSISDVTFGKAFVHISTRTKRHPSYAAAFESMLRSPNRIPNPDWNQALINAAGYCSPEMLALFLAQPERVTDDALKAVLRKARNSQTIQTLIKHIMKEFH